MINLLDSTNMKKIITNIVLFIGILPAIWAQQELDRANMLFKKTYYADAIPLYEEALKSNKSSALIKNLADSYYHTFNLHAAARWYKYLISNYGDTVGETYYFRLNQTLKAIGNYEAAEMVLINYYNKQGDTVKLEELEQAINYLENVKAIGNRFVLENSAFNTSLSEFGAIRIGKELWYTATHKKSVSKTYKWNNEKYLDIYKHPLDKQNLGYSLSIPLPGSTNSKINDGAVTIPTHGKTLYFNRNNFKTG